MPKFKLKKLEQIKGRNTFYKLVKGKKCEFDEFCEEMEKPDKYPSELKVIFTIMDLASNQQPLPKTKIKDITLLKTLTKSMNLRRKTLEFMGFNKKEQERLLFVVEQKGVKNPISGIFDKLKSSI